MKISVMASSLASTALGTPALAQEGQWYVGDTRTSNEAMTREEAKALYGTNVYLLSYELPPDPPFFDKNTERKRNRWPAVPR